MVIDLSQVFHDKKGKPVKMERGSDDETTLGDAAYMALTAMYVGEESLSREHKLRRGRLAQKIVASTDGKLDIKSEDVTEIKHCIAKMFDPWIVVQSEDMIEPPLKE